jgi:hypothetical protein
MFGSIDRSKGYLFATYDLGHSLRNTVEKMRQEIEGTSRRQQNFRRPPTGRKAPANAKHDLCPCARDETSTRGTGARGAKACCRAR